MSNVSMASIRAVQMGPGIDPDLFAVPTGVFLLGIGTRTLFLHDYPYLSRGISEQPVFEHAALFRPEAVPALAHEQQFAALIGNSTDQEFADVILPLSRVPGVNILVLAALLINELLDPMEVFDWIGADINNLPRTPMLGRPEDILKLDEPGKIVNGRPTKYMIFADTHLDAPQDFEFRVDHFSDNADLFLRALEYCDTNGYTVLVLGDFAELWYEDTFEPTRRQSKLDRFKDIVQLHGPVLQKMADLAADGRFFRCTGNHDHFEWKDSAVAAWSNAHVSLPIHGGFIIPQCKTMDDFLPHLGLNPEDYTNRADMLLMHGHQFDFWNCDEHNRLGQFITNAVGVPPDAFDNVLYDYRGIDRLGHPLLEFWDFLTDLQPFANWPPKEVARQWTERLENKPYTDNFTVDSIIFPETAVALMAYLMRSGPPSPANFSVNLCIGHTHNPQSRPWIPFLERFNPWREEEILGFLVFENLFALKTRLHSVGPTAWWQYIVWATEITETGQPRMGYWSIEDDAEHYHPIGMDWELSDRGPLPAPPFAPLQAWADQYLEKDIQTALAAVHSSLQPPAYQPPPSAGAAFRRSWKTAPKLTTQPDNSTLTALLDAIARSSAPLRPQLPLMSTAAVGASLATGRNTNLSIAARLLAARHDSVFGGIRSPADELATPYAASVGSDARSIGANPISLDLWPRLIAGCPPTTTTPALDLAALLRGLWGSYWPRPARPVAHRPANARGEYGTGRARPPTAWPPADLRSASAAGSAGLRIRVTSQPTTR
jgi:UDP-2,3-diacylglucosamine pyrophosphatase LpxH